MARFTTPCGRRAFSRVELLIALAIVATLIGLLIPGVMHVRDQAARTVDL